MSSPWADIGREIASNLNVVKTLIKVIREGYRQAVSIYDDQTSRQTRERIIGLANTMTGVNATKKTVAELLDGYLAQPAGKGNWPRMQEDLLAVAEQIDKIEKEVQETGKAIINVAGFNIKNDLTSVLRTQSKKYRELAGQEAPESKTDRKNAKIAVKNLEKLLSNVVALESKLTIDTLSLKTGRAETKPAKTKSSKTKASKTKASKIKSSKTKRAKN